MARRRPGGQVVTVDTWEASGAPISTLVASWQRALQAQNRVPGTWRTYGYALSSLQRYLDAQGHSGRVGDLTRQDCELFIADLLAHRAPATARLYANITHIFLAWCVAEGEIAASPMERVARPVVAPKVTPVLEEAQVRALLKTCEGNAFDERRDAAILRLLLTTGMRRAELAALTVADVDLERMVAHAVVKGRREHVFPFGRKARLALDRYLRARARHPSAALPDLWLGHQGVFGYRGVYDMVVRRAKQAGLGHIWPHLLRHTYAHTWLEAGGSEQGLMRNIGWRSRAMLDHYGRSVADQRARDEYQRLQPGDQF